MFSGDMARARAHEPLRPVTRPLPRAPRTRAPPNPCGTSQDSGAAEQRGKRGGPPPWALRLMRRAGARRAGAVAAAVIGVALIVGVSGARVARQNIGYVG